MCPRTYNIRMSNVLLACVCSTPSLFSTPLQEPGLMMLPRLTLIPKTCLLRVIDNDTGVEVPQLFHKVIPHHYKPNKVMNCL